jgi:hypothetical protein
MKMKNEHESILHKMEGWNDYEACFSRLLCKKEWEADVFQNGKSHRVTMQGLTFDLTRSRMRRPEVEKWGGWIWIFQASWLQYTKDRLVVN